MKRLTLTLALALCVGLSAATAQNITKSLQGSQDPRGPVGLDASNNAYFPNHILGTGNNGKVMALSNCGNATTSAFVAGSTDVAGTFTPGTATCTLNFGTAFAIPPTCWVHSTQATSVAGITETTTGITLTSLTGATSWSYLCIGNQ